MVVSDQRLQKNLHKTLKKQWYYFRGALNQTLLLQNTLQLTIMCPKMQTKELYVKQQTST